MTITKVCLKSSFFEQANVVVKHPNFDDNELELYLMKAIPGVFFVKILGKGVEKHPDIVLDNHGRKVEKYNAII